MSCEIVEVFELWKEVMGHPNANMDAKRKSVIAKRLSDGYTVDQLKTAINGCAQSAWHMGDNQRGNRYDALTLILRDADHVDKFIAIAERPVTKQKTVESFREREERLLRERYEQAVGIRRNREASNIIDITPLQRMERIA